MATPLIELRDLRYRYAGTSDLALDAITWMVDSGFHVIAGDSGSGKSTLLRTLNGLVPHFHGGAISGAVRVAGTDVIAGSVRAMAQRVGFVFQDPEMQSVAARVDADVAFGLTNLRVAPAEMRTRVEEALEMVGLSGFAGRRVATLSGGERQRVALAGTLVMRPQVVVLDEPLSQLDSEGAAHLVSTCAHLANNGTAVVMAEHRLAELAPELPATVIDGGRISATTRVGELITPTTAAGRSREASAATRWHIDCADIGVEGAPLIGAASASGTAGEVTALTGANGSGKTTLLRTLARLMEPLSGSVDVSGRVAYLPQNPASLLYRQTVADELAYALLRSRSPAGVDDWLALMGLSNVRDRFSRDLSSGQRQRVAIAATLCTAPDIALLDEPTRGMDAQARAQLHRALSRCQDAGTSVVFATHDLELVQRLGATRYHIADHRLHRLSGQPESENAA